MTQEPLYMTSFYRPRPKSSSRSSSRLVNREAVPRALLAGLGARSKSSWSLPSVAGEPFDARVERARGTGGRFGDAASLVFFFGGMVQAIGVSDSGKRINLGRQGRNSWASQPNKRFSGKRPPESIEALNTDWE